MFCPNCNTEYRSGFTQCSDCGVGLIEHIPGDASSGDVGTPTDSEGHELLWRGISPGSCNEIREALDTAGIFHKDTDKEFGILPTLTQAAYFIWIDPRDRDAAQAALAEALRKYRDDEQQGNEFA